MCDDIRPRLSSTSLYTKFSAFKSALVRFSRAVDRARRFAKTI